MGLSKEGSEKAKVYGAGYTPTYREGTEIYPIETKGKKDVLSHAEKFFGSHARLDLATTLEQKFCN